MSSNAVSDSQNDEVDLLQLVGRLWHGRIYILVCVLVAGAIGLVIAAGTPPTYRADSLVQLEQRSGQLALPDSLAALSDDAPESAAEIEILMSRSVMSEAVAQEHLDWIATATEPSKILGTLFRFGVPLPGWDVFEQYARGGESLAISYLEVPDAWLMEPIALTVVSQDSYRLELPDGRELEGAPGDMLRDAESGFALNIGEINSPPKRVFTIRHLTEAAAIDRLRGRFSVNERGRGTNVLELAIVSGSRSMAERELRAIANAYQQQNISRSSAEAQSSLDFVQQQLPQAEAEVRAAEAELNRFRSAQSAIDLSFEAQSVLTQITTLEANLRQLAAEEDELAERYTPNHPVYRQLLAEKGRLEARLEELQAEVGDLPQTQREVVNLTRNVEIAQQVYVQLLNRAQELQVLRASTIGNVRIIDQARTAQLPVAPARSRIVALAVLLGLIVGAAFVFIRAMLHRGIEDTRVIETAGLPVFATINHSPTAENHRKVKGSLPLLVESHDHDIVTEGFKSLRTSLHFGMLDADVKSMVITGPAPGVGKSFIAANLSAVNAQSGQRTCLIDADMRMGYLRRYFDIPKVHLGLSDVLAGTATLEQVLHQTRVEGLSFIPSGQFPPNPSELLMRDAFKDLLAELNRHFDMTFIDTPPPLAVTDPLIVSRVAGATLLVARFAQTQLPEIEAVQQQYLNAGLKLTGAVFNGFDPKRVSSGRYQYGYSYGYRYAYGDKKKSR